LDIRFAVGSICKENRMLTSRAYAALENVFEEVHVRFQRGLVRARLRTAADGNEVVVCFTTNGDHSCGYQCTSEYAP
jgi:hypothetical protein